MHPAPPEGDKLHRNGSGRRRRLTRRGAGALLMAALLAAAPAAVAETDVEQVIVAGEYHYARGRRSGVQISFDRGHTWQARGEGLPRRIAYPFPETPAFAAVTHLAADPANPRRLAATTATGLYLTTDGGESWQEIPVEQVPFNTYFTSVALSPHDPAGMLLGTSFHGIFETVDGGATWWHLRPVIGFLTDAALFYEEVAAVSYDPAAPRAMAVLAGFDGGIYHVEDRSATGAGGSSSPVRHYPAPAAGTIQLAYAPAGEGWELRSGTIDAWWRLTASGAWAPVDALAQQLHGAPPRPLAPAPASPAAGSQPPPAPAAAPAASIPDKPRPDAAAATATAGALRPDTAAPRLAARPSPAPAAAAASAPRPQAALRSGIYLSTHRAAAALPEYLEFLNRHGLNSVVIDFKTDDGALSYDSDLPLAHRIGAAPGPIRLDRLIEQAHQAGIYVIARLVVFKDRYLYDWQEHRLAVWDAELDAPWRHLVAGDDPETRVQREYWVDPYAPEVWQYNVAVAAELAERGVDEIQFDYIRFPSDGPVERSRHRHRRPGMRRIDAIESFLALARERLEVPISIDLFGFNSWYRAGNWLGQDIAVLSEYADVISPMFYPSHFPDHFLDDRSYAERAYAIYEAGVRRAQRMVQGRSYIRPYVQAFLIGRELRMEEPEFSDYLIRQLDGTRAAAGSGFTLWNATNRYYMVTKPLQPYFDARGEEMP